MSRVAGTLPMPHDPDRRHDRATERSEADLWQTLDMIPTPAWATLVDGSVDFLNRNWLEYTGLPAEGVLGWGWKIAFHPDDRDRVERRWREIAQSRALGELEVRLRRHDGVFRWFLLRASAYRDSEGNVLGCLATYTDIEDRKRAEEELRLNAARLEQAEGLTRAASFEWNATTDELVWSKEC